MNRPKMTFKRPDGYMVYWGTILVSAGLSITASTIDVIRRSPLIDALDMQTPWDSSRPLPERPEGVTKLHSWSMPLSGTNMNAYIAFEDTVIDAVDRSGQPVTLHCRQSEIGQLRPISSNSPFYERSIVWSESLAKKHCQPVSQPTRNTEKRGQEVSSQVVHAAPTP